MRRLVTVFLILMILVGCTGKNIPDGEVYIAPLPLKYVRVGDVQIGYRSFGHGDPLLMIMGFAGTMDLWDLQLIRKLSKEHTVIIYDNRGAGSSTAGTREITIRRMAEDAAGLLKQLNYETAHILGWSMGGMIAQELALQHPSMVNKLILMGTSCNRRAVAETTKLLLRMDTGELLSHFFPAGWLDRYPDAIKDLPRPGIYPDQNIVKAQAEAMLNWPGTCERLYRIDKDTLILAGMADTILPASLSMELAGRINGSWLARYRNATHWMMYQDPDGLGQTLNTFLQVKEDLLEH